MATHSSVLAWRIPGMAELSGLPSMGPHRVRHDWSDLAAAAAAFIQHNVFEVHPCHHIHQYLSLFIIDHLYSIIWLNHSLFAGQEDPWSRKWQPTAVFLPGESRWQRNLMGYCPWGCRVGCDWACTHTNTQAVSSLGLLWMKISYTSPSLGEHLEIELSGHRKVYN